MSVVRTCGVIVLAATDRPRASAGLGQFELKLGTAQCIGCPVAVPAFEVAQPVLAVHLTRAESCAEVGQTYGPVEWGGHES